MKENSMSDIIRRAIAAADTANSAKARELTERATSLSSLIHESAQQIQNEHIELAQSKVERENRRHNEIIEKQQALIDTQAELLAEARKSKWWTSLWVSIASAILAFLLGKLF